MNRQRYLHYNATGRGGVNQQDELARPGYELADARNVWAPNGRIEARPGFVGVASINSQTQASAINDEVYIKEAPIGTFTSATSGTLSLNSLAVGQRWYFGFSNEPTGNAFYINLTATNSNSSNYTPEYWNGTSWRHLYGIREFVADGTTVTHLNAAISAWLYIPPGDWAKTTVDSYNRYYVRFTIKDTALDSTVTINANSTAAFLSTTGIKGLLPAQFSANKRYLFLVDKLSSDGVSIDRLGYYNYVDLGSFSDLNSAGFQLRNPLPEGDEPATFAVAPEFDEAFSAYGYQTARWTATDSGTIDTATSVENRDSIVGSNAPYDPDYIAQLNAFPECKYISYFKNRLWFAGIKDDPFGIRWSAAAPYYKVLPALSREVLMEDDNSPITAIQPLGEHMVVFKQDSIWIMVKTGVDEFDLTLYVPQRVVAGVGCVSNSSVKKISGKLFFLAEDGVYVFDGTPKIIKISDKVQGIIDSINAGQRRFAAAGHWKKKNLYLLSFSTDGAETNDITIVFDYKNNSWWVWSGIDGRFWVSDEDVADNESLYFGTSTGRVYQIGVGINDDGTAISSYVVTQRFGREDTAKKMLRYIDVESTNKSGSSVTLEPLVNDEKSGVSGITGTADFTDSNDIGYERRREVRMGFRREFDWLQARISHSTKDAKFKISGIDMAYYRKGVR